MNDVARAVIFGRDAHNYERFRPSYPQEAIDHVLGLDTGGDLLEIGAGTGKATVDMVGPGRNITCLEPSPGMAEVLAGRELQGVKVVAATFEEWDGDNGSLDLIYSAQAWHWVDHDTAYGRALRLLRPGGAIALIWNVMTHRYDRFEDVYRRFAPQIVDERDERIRKRDHHTWSDDLATAGFEDVDRLTLHWEATLDADEYTGLCATYSDHMLVPEPNRTALLAAIRKAIDPEGVTVAYRTEVFSGRSPLG